MKKKKRPGIERPFTFAELCSLVEKEAKNKGVPYFDELDYFRRLYYMVTGEKPEDIKRLQEQNFTVREIEILSKKPKSSVARELKEMIEDE